MHTQKSIHVGLPHHCSKFIAVNCSVIPTRNSMINGAKLAVASVARATPLFLPRPEFIYITVVHYSAPLRTFLLRATLPLCPDWCHWKWVWIKSMFRWWKLMLFLNGDGEDHLIYLLMTLNRI